MKCCTFIGHKDCPVEMFDKLYYEIEKLILKENVRVFYVGTNGNFDRMVYQVLEKLESKHTITIHVVLAYLNIKKDNMYFDIDKTIFPDVLEKTPFRYAINKRNEYMIKKSDYIICFVNNTFSNSYNYLRVAMKNNLEIINIGGLK